MSRLLEASDFTARALPQNPFSESDLSQVHAAFNICLGLESRAPLVPLPHAKHPAVLICARVLGFTLIEAPSDDGRAHTAISINSGNDDKTLLALGKYYIECLFRLFESAERPTPAASEYSSRPDLDNTQEVCKYTLQKASLSYNTTKDAAVVRDGFHCVIKTNVYDGEYFERHRSTIAGQDPEWDVSTLRCVHILPEGLSSDLGSIQAPFDKDNQPNTYTVMSTMWGILERLRSRTITFTTPDAGALPLPSPAYLAIRSAWCRVAHLSGAAGYVTTVLREEEELRDRGVLAEDGSSMDVFERYIAVHGV